MLLEEKKALAQSWFRDLRDRICVEFEALEQQADPLLYSADPGHFERKLWEREGGGGGEISKMRGRLFEKVGVNISSVHGEFSETFRKEIPGADADPRFFAAGISLVAHMANPHIPAVHMNTRFIVIGEGGATEKDSGRAWFGGGSDLNPMFQNEELETYFHAQFRECCNRHDADYYDKFKAWCDEYFFIKHRNEARGAGGIFYDYLNTGEWNADFAFTQDVGNTFLKTYSSIIQKMMNAIWSADDRKHQLFKRGRYAEFNLVYDRGTRFGLMTGGNAEAILMSLPPVATWD